VDRLSGDLPGVAGYDAEPQGERERIDVRLRGRALRLDLRIRARIHRPTALIASSMPGRRQYGLQVLIVPHLRGMRRIEARIARRIGRLAVPASVLLAAAPAKERAVVPLGAVAMPPSAWSSRSA
jgi:hypothetical protein